MKRITTCTPYTGELTLAQRTKILDFLWDSLCSVKGKDQVQTGYGTKTKTGLLYTIENIVLGPSKENPN